MRHQIYARSASRFSIFRQMGHILPCNGLAGACELLQNSSILACLFVEHLSLAMEIIRVFHIGAIFSLNMCTITAAAAAVSQPVNSLAIGPVTNSTALSLPANSVNL